MNMLDDEDDQSFHATRDGYSHLSDVEWDAVERMGSTMGIHAVSVMLEALNRDAQHATIAKFIQNELDAEREKVALLHQQGSQQAELLREQGAQQFELLRQQQAAAGGSMHSRRPETLKIDISKARRIDDGDMQVAFAQSNLAGRAKTWALGLKLHDPYAFGSLEVFKSRLRQTFEPPRAEFRARTELLKLKQGKRDVHAYAQHIRHLTSCISFNPVDEHTLVSVFMQGLADGPVKTHLFRLELDSLEQAISIAEQEDFSLRQARASSTSYRQPRRYDNGGPEPMELCYVESEKARSTGYKKLQRCNRCQKTGHYAYECSAPRPVSRDTGRSDRPPMRKGQGRGSAVGAKTQQRDGPSKNGQDQLLTDAQLRGPGGLEVHEAELLAVEDLAKPFSSPDEMRQMAQRRLIVQQSADAAAQAAVTPAVPVATSSPPPAAEPQPTGGRRPWPPVQPSPPQLNDSNGSYLVLQEDDRAEEGPSSPFEGSVASAPPQPGTGGSSTPAFSARLSHSRLLPEDQARKQASGIRGPAVVTAGPALLTQQRRERLTCEKLLKLLPDRQCHSIPMDPKPPAEPIHMGELVSILGLREINTPANGNCLAIALAQAVAESALTAPAKDQELLTACIKRGITCTGLLNLEDQLPHDLRMQALKNVGRGWASMTRTESASQFRWFLTDFAATPSGRTSHVPTDCWGGQ
uniref:CCHC-type domain-containing protein n=2 Tax=Peronospora matthiolae TaxID=2874970 RepID=A0AAV1VCS0_9STRA